jgi:hypothetical protein|tara:strand:- start:76 stop:1206 length:1131 start_codon:yes stop_codon:yes gene_type:complete
MKKLNILAALLMYSAPAAFAGEINFPKYFFSEGTKECKIDYLRSEIILDDDATSYIKKVAGYDWEEDHNKRSNSLTVMHEKISDPIMYLNSGTFNAVQDNDKESIKNAVSLLVEIAVKKSLMNTSTPEQSTGRCYGKGSNSICPIHAPQEVMIFATHYIITAINLKPYLNVEEKVIVDTYIDNIYTKYVKYFAEQEIKRGMYQMANGGISRLAYAHYTGNKELAEIEFKKRFTQFKKIILKDGYLNNNSFRGVRALWYHSLGSNNILGYIALAKAFKVEIPTDVFTLAKKTAEVTNLGIDNYKKFKSRSAGFSIYTGNSSNDQRVARKHTHQLAMNYSNLTFKVVGIEMSDDFRWKRMSGKYHMDRQLGFVPKCLD